MIKVLIQSSQSLKHSSQVALSLNSFKWEIFSPVCSSQHSRLPWGKHRNSNGATQQRSDSAVQTPIFVSVWWGKRGILTLCIILRAFSLVRMDHSTASPGAGWQFQSYLTEPGLVCQMCSDLCTIRRTLPDSMGGSTTPAHHRRGRAKFRLLVCCIHGRRSVFKWICSIHFVTSVHKHRFAFWQRAVLTVSVKSRRLSVTNHKVKLEGKKEEAKLNSLVTFHISYLYSLF